MVAAKKTAPASRGVAKTPEVEGKGDLVNDRVGSLVSRGRMFHQMEGGRSTCCSAPARADARW
jgi:hypothetical protein